MSETNARLSGSASPALRARLVTFDRGFSSTAEIERPDRYRVLEGLGQQGHYIARGGGYSYCAASFGGGGVVIDMTLFNRVLRFDPSARMIEVEAGIRLGDLLGITAQAQLWLPVQPGYPDITVGGCIAPNVHGKNPTRSGTFRHSVVDVTLFHPDRGTQRIDATTDPELFELTCGGFGLTGVIVAATLQLEPLPGSRLSMERRPLGGLTDGLRAVRAQQPNAAFTYTWHDAATGLGRFGRGIAYSGTFIGGRFAAADQHRSYRSIDPSGGRVPLPGWNAATTSLFNFAHYLLERSRPKSEELTIFDSLFPFARRPAIFLLFGRAGFIEHQVIVPDQAIDEYLTRVERLCRTPATPSVLISMKQFRGQQRWLRFEADGVCVTSYLRRTPAGFGALAELERLAQATGSLINIMKDSRLPVEVVRATYPEYESFKSAMRKYDPRQVYRSGLSERLAL